MDDRIPLPWHPFTLDVNNDGTFTVTDVGLWLHHTFFLPGDWLLWMLLRYVPELTGFLEVDQSEYGSTFSALLSVFVWLFVSVFLLTATHWLSMADRALTRLLRGTVMRFVTITRVVFRDGAGIAQRKYQEIAQSVSPRPGSNVKLSPEELRVLQAHAYVDPSSSLALSDLVRATGVPRMQIVAILDRLRELQLIDRRSDQGGTDSGYALTAPGRDFLSTGP